MTFKERMIMASVITNVGIILSLFTPIIPIYFGIGCFGYQFVAHLISKR